jgi:hypothetical protein
MSQKWAELVKKLIWTSGGSLGLKWAYFGEYSFGSARRRLGGSAQIWRPCGSVVFFLWMRRLCVGFNAGISGVACRPPLAPMDLIFATWSLYWWTLHGRMIKMDFGQLWKNRCITKNSSVSNERDFDTNCWWERPLVVALKHSEGIKHNVLFQQQEAYNN